MKEVCVATPGLRGAMEILGVMSEDVPQLNYRLSTADVHGARVYGQLPLYLASAADSVVLLDVNVRSGERLADFNADELADRVTGVSEYRTTRKKLTPEEVANART